MNPYHPHPYHPPMQHTYTDKQTILVAFDHRIKYRDVFSMKLLYVLMHDWLCDQGWEKRIDPAFRETFYLHRWTQNSGEEIWFYWRTQKVITSYYRFDLDVDCHVVGLKDFDQIYEGKKFKANYGEVEIKLFAKVVADPWGEWAKDSITKHFRTIFFKRTFWKDLDTHKFELYNELYRFLDAIKTYLKLKAYNPEPEMHKFGWNKDMEPMQ